MSREHRWALDFEYPYDAICRVYCVECGEEMSWSELADRLNGAPDARRWARAWKQAATFWRQEAIALRHEHSMSYSIYPLFKHKKPPR